MTLAACVVNKNFEIMAAAKALRKMRHLHVFLVCPPAALPLHAGMRPECISIPGFPAVHKPKSWVGRKE